VGKDNLRSQRALEKIGALRTAARRDALGTERVCFQMSAARWEAVRSARATAAPPVP